MRLLEWVDMVKATGGVPEGSYDTLAAMRSASALCWAEIDRRGYPCNEIAQLGVKWVAAFMVSCARHGTTAFSSILAPSDYRQRIFQLEARRNDGVIAQILHEAASAPRQAFDTALLAVGAHGAVAPAGRGKGVVG